MDKDRAYLIRDRDHTFASCFARVAATSGIKILKTPYHTPRANAICERFLGSVRRECLDHLLILQEKQLDRVLHAYGEYFNRARPHQGIRQQIPAWYGEPVPLDHQRGKILALPVLGGLHHDYREIRLTAERCADKRMFSYGGICLIREVADLRLLSPYCSDDDDKQGFCVFSGKALHASKRRPLHGLAFLPEAATQEGPEAIRPSLYSGDNSWSQHVRLLLRDILGTDPPIFSDRILKVASTGSQRTLP